MILFILSCIVSVFVLLLLAFSISCYLTLPTRVLKCPSEERLDGKVVIVTGANSGIGLETAKELARRGGRVLLACRNEARGLAAQHAVRSASGNPDVVYRHLDLACIASVRKFAQHVLSTEKHLHVLVNNAGGYAYPERYTADGIVESMQINYFGPFLLTLLLLPLLRKSQPSRIINVSSCLHLFGVIDFKYLNKTNAYSNIRWYSNSKLCELLFTVELARRLEGTGVVANALHPGVVKSNILHNVTSKGFLELVFLFLCWILNSSAEIASQTTVYLAVSKECENVSGKYFSDCEQAVSHYLRHNRALTKTLWEYSEKLVGQKCDL